MTKCKTLVWFAMPALLLAACTPSAQDAGDSAGERAGEEAGAPSSTSVARPPSHNFEEVAPGVYFATGAGTVNVASNAMVVINEEDVLVVDSHITADAARELLRSIAELTDKPVRFLVNSHFHFDHAHGNQVFPDGVLTIGHEYTRERLLGDVLHEPTYQTIGSPASQQALVEGLETRVAEEADAEVRASLEAQLAVLRRHIQALDEVEPTPPDTTLVRKLTLFRGSREIQLHHLGRGHTGGDVVVFLPAEKVVFTGDLFYDGAAYLGDGYIADFIDTLGKLEQLDFDIVVPGHGPLVRDRSKIRFAQDYLRQYLDQVRKLHAQGLAEETIVERVDLSGYESYAAFQLNAPAVKALEIRRMLQLIEAGAM